MAGKTVATYWIAILFICSAQFSCKKDETAVARPKLEILTTTEWKVKNLYLRDKGEPVSANVEARSFTFKDCELDDVYIFRSDNLFMRKDSLVTCDPLILDPFHIGIFGPHNTGTWSVDAGFTQMGVTSTFYNFTWKILAISEGLFEIEQNYTDIFGGEYIYTYRFAPLK